MRKAAALLLPLLAVGCSCQPHDRDATAARPRDAAAVGAAAETSATIAPADTPVLAAVPAPEAREAARTVHAYFQALLQQRRDGNAFWSGGRPPPQPDDAIVRAWPQVQRMRVVTGQARPLDRQLPADTLEIPVELSADTAQGLLRAGGWYRLHRRLDGSGWEITSASLRPHLD